MANPFLVLPVTIFSLRVVIMAENFLPHPAYGHPLPKERGGNPSPLRERGRGEGE
jgi:hypothetical protein